MHKLIELAEQSSLRENELNFAIGDTVDGRQRLVSELTLKDGRRV